MKRLLKNNNNKMYIPLSPGKRFVSSGTLTQLGSTIGTYQHSSGEYTTQVELQWLKANLIEVNLATGLCGSVLSNPNIRKHPCTISVSLYL